MPRSSCIRNQVADGIANRVSRPSSRSADYSAAFVALCIAGAILAVGTEHRSNLVLLEHYKRDARYPRFAIC